MGQNLQDHLTLITPNSLQHKATRSSKVFALHKAGYLGETLPRIRRTEGRIERAMHGVTDPDDLRTLTSALCMAIEQRRILLRIPGPGRDTPMDQRTVMLASDASIVDVAPAQAPVPPA